MIEINRRLNTCLNALDCLLPKAEYDVPKVLMIDDDDKSLSAFKASFRRDTEVFIAINRKEALEIINNNKIDIVFCDFKMQDVNGADILMEILDIHPNIRTHIVTGYADKEVANEIKAKLNTNDIMYKPLNLDDVFSRIFNYNQIA